MLTVRPAALTGSGREGCRYLRRPIRSEEGPGTGDIGGGTPQPGRQERGNRRMLGCERFMESRAPLSLQNARGVMIRCYRSKERTVSASEGRRVEAFKTLAEWLPLSREYPLLLRVLAMLWVALGLGLVVVTRHYRSSHEPTSTAAVSVDARNAQGPVLAAGRDVIVNGPVYSGQPPSPPISVPNTPPPDPDKAEIIALLRMNLATDSCVVSEHKRLPDARTPELLREVDVVMECHLDDIPVVASFEIAPGSAPADVPWVEQLISKHQHLPTTNLFLVSWAGFTEAAVRIGRVTPKVQLVTPDLPKGSAVQKTQLAVDWLSFTPLKVTAVVTLPSGTEQRVVLDPAENTLFYSPIGTEIGSVVEFVKGVVNSSDVMRSVWAEANRSPQPTDFRYLVLGLPADALRSTLGDAPSLRWQSTGELHHIELIEIAGDIALHRVPLSFAIGSFGDVKFAHATASVAGNTATVVGKVAEDNHVERLTVRFRPQLSKDAKASPGGTPP